MPEIKYRCSRADQLDRAYHRIGDRGIKNSYGLRQSLRWPWLLAVAISLTLWVLFVGAIWECIRYASRY
jgi:hypothetical protein